MNLENIGFYSFERLHTSAAGTYMCTTQLHSNRRRTQYVDFSGKDSEAGRWRANMSRELAALKARMSRQQQETATNGEQELASLH